MNEYRPTHLCIIPMHMFRRNGDKVIHLAKRVNPSIIREERSLRVMQQMIKSYDLKSKTLTKLNVPRSNALGCVGLHEARKSDLIVPRARTVMTKTLAFAFIGPALCNQLPPVTRSSLLTGGPSASFRCLKTSFFSLGL